MLYLLSKRKVTWKIIQSRKQKKKQLKRKNDRSSDSSDSSDNDDQEETFSHLNADAVCKYIRKTPIIIQIPGPRLADYQTGGNPLISIPNNYQVNICFSSFELILVSLTPTIFLT